MENIKKLGIYLRVSTEGQADDEKYSIPIQREMGKKFAEDEEIDYEIFEDHKSGGSVDRAGWQALFEKIDSGEIEGIWIAKFDRFSRDTADGLTAIKTMRKTGCRLWVNSLEYDIHDPNTEFLITMQFAFAAYERAQIKARTMAGKKKARDEGNRIVVDMLGWNRYINDEGKRSVRLNEDEAKIVRFIFAEYLAGTNIPDIGRKLVDAGYKGKYSGKTYKYPSGEEKTIEDRWVYST
ncbi:MAG TPA: recombinase family protein, partial [Treponemataceae bacterium]|nr:recombinase family protein [Treponemataceae bacterium]